MSRQKKTRKIYDVMPARKSEQDNSHKIKVKSRAKLSRYELDAKAWEEKRKRKHKGKSAGNRNQTASQAKLQPSPKNLDPRLGSKRLIPLEVINTVTAEVTTKPKATSKATLQPKPKVLEQELFELENNECLNQLLEDLETGKNLTTADQEFVDECLNRIEYLMQELGISEDLDSEEALYSAFEKANLDQYRY